MAGETANSQTLIFWGSGATKALGMRTTADQAKFIHCITDAGRVHTALRERISEALDHNDRERWRDALFDLITILGDDEGAFESIGAISTDQIEAMRRNWQQGTKDEDLCKQIIHLRLIYDWPALKSVVRLCPGNTPEAFRLNDLFNLLDTHIPSAFGFRGPVAGGSTEGERQFLDVRRLVGAKNALLMMLIASFYIDYQECVDSRREVLEQYRGFAERLGRRMQREGLRLASDDTLDQPAFYRGDVSFASLNYDPIALWVGFVANRELNHGAAVPHVGFPATPLHVFHDFGHMIPARRIGRSSRGPWYPMNEGVAQRLNELKGGADHRVRLTKFLFPHGCLCWRECPDCGKLSSFHGDTWDLDSRSLFPPPPLQAFDRDPPREWIPKRERDQRRKGKVDARECLHCGTSTFTHHTQAIMQSSFKPRAPSFIEEIERDLRATTMGARHIILMGYSLPLDDVTYRAFLSARTKGDDALKVHCTVVDKDDANPGWHGSDALKRQHGIRDFPPVRQACEIFGPDRVRFYGGGVPDVFLDQGRATDARLDKLLTWPDR